MEVLYAAASLSRLPDTVMETASSGAEAGAGAFSRLQQQFVQRMQCEPPPDPLPDPLLAAAAERRRAQYAASKQRLREAQAQKRKQAAEARKQRHRSAAAPAPAPAAGTAAAPTPAPAAGTDASPQPAATPTEAAAAAGPQGRVAAELAMEWSQQELSQVPLAQVQLLLQGGQMSVLQAQQIHAGQRQRRAVERQQQHHTRRQQAAAAAAPAAAAAAAQQQQQQQPPAPQQQQQGPRRSARVAQQQQEQQQQQAQQRAPPPPRAHRVAAGGKAALQPVVEGPRFPKHNLGPRALQCSHCHAKLWQQENKGTVAAPHGGSLCCYQGKSCSIQDSFQPPPQLIRELFTSNSPRSRGFRKQARAYNSALQMASSGLRDIAPQQGVSVIAIRGAVHHLLGPLVPADGQQKQFAQLYIIDDPQDEVQSRIAALGQAGSALDAALLQEIQDCLHNNNTYVRAIKQTMVGCISCMGPASCLYC
jgi:hypothetical protein